MGFCQNALSIRGDGVRSASTVDVLVALRSDGQR